jgi:two-component system, OmpR family, sensor histidine kinase VicK
MAKKRGIPPQKTPQRHPKSPLPINSVEIDNSVEIELRRQTQRIQLFSEVTLKIRQSLQLKDILQTTVTEVQRILNADRVLIYQVFADGTGKAISEAVLPKYPSILDQAFPEEVFPSDYQTLYAQGRVRAIANVYDPAAELADCLVEFVAQFDIQAKLIVPILSAFESQPLWGLLIAHQCGTPRQWVEFELELMQQLADQISIAIAQGVLMENLEDVVATRTAALRRSEEQLRLITNALPVLIAYVDQAQCYRFNNQAYEEWVGLPVDRIFGCSLHKIWGKVSYQQMQAPIQAALAGQTMSYDHEMQLPQGMTRSVNITYVPHWDDAQQGVLGCFEMITDISERKAIERMKDEFISVVSHELRTPLTSIHSALKILASGGLGRLSADGQQVLEIADENTDRLVRLVNNVLDLQRIESGAVTMNPQACNAADLMQKATDEMQAMAQQQGVELVTTPIDLALWVDADYIVQAITNLLSNAIKFSHVGDRVRLTAQLPSEAKASEGKASGDKTSEDKTSGDKTSEGKVSEGKSDQPSQIQFQVCDQGPGIPENKLEQIFERFQQVDSSDARKKGGTGLGLTICRKIIEQHGGKIWAENQLERGSIFSFTLPIVTEQNPPSLGIEVE